MNIINNLENSIENNPNFKYIKELVGFLLNEDENITSFVGYDLGIGKPQSELSYEAETSIYCQNFELGVLNQGFFQMTTFNEEKWSEMRKYLEDEKEDIKEINFFFCSTSLVDAASPILAVFPIINIYHTGIGIQLIGRGKGNSTNEGKIKRTIMIQLEFGDLDSLGDASNRFLTPQFCMTPIYLDAEKTKLKSPMKFTPEEFNKNLFIDYSKSISTIMGNFLESQDYISEKLVKAMATTDAVNVRNTAPMPYQDFLRQNLTMQSFFDAYNNYRKSSDRIGGNADGSIFELCGFGPSPLSQKSGAIINFATSKSVKDLVKVIDFVFTNYNGCASGMKNANQHYCLMGVDKVTPIESLTDAQIDDLLSTRPNVVSSDNGFIREMRGRTTHCNTVCAVLVTLCEQLEKDNKEHWKKHVDWESIDVQESNFYMLNPAIPNIPIAEFDPAYEFGVSIHDFNTNPIFAEDKKKFYKYMFFIKMLTANMLSVGEQAVLNGTGADVSNLSQKVFYYIIQVFQSGFANDVIKILFSKDFFSKYQYTYIFLMMLLVLYVVISFEIFDEFFWVTGQPTVDQNGEPNINVIDPYPYVWKINVKKNAPVLSAYIKNYFKS